MEWLQESALLLPNWAWIAIAAVIVVLAIVIIAVAVSGRKRKQKAQAAEKQSEEAAATEAAYAPVSEPEKHEVISGFYEPDHGYSQPVTYAAPEAQTNASATDDEFEKTAGVYEVSVKVEEEAVGAKSTAKKTAAKPAAKKTAAKPAATKKEEPAKTTASKTAAKSTTKKEEEKPVAKKSAAKPAATKKEEPAKATASKPAVKPAAKAEPDEEKKNRVYHISKRKEDGMWQIKASGGAKAIKLFRTQVEAIDAAVTLAQNQGGRVVVHKANGAFKSISLANYVSQS